MYFISVINHYISCFTDSGGFFWSPFVQDNLDTYTVGALYEAFPAEKARAIGARLEIHYTPKHGSWLNIAEIELSALTRQCLSRRMEDLETLKEEISAWETNKNLNAKSVVG
jgi:hypothetical protein